MKNFTVFSRIGISLIIPGIILGCSITQKEYLSTIVDENTDINTRIMLGTESIRTQAAGSTKITQSVDTPSAVEKTPLNAPPIATDNQYLINIITTNGGCQFPCIWGINPIDYDATNGHKLLLNMLANTLTDYDFASVYYESNKSEIYMGKGIGDIQLRHRLVWEGERESQTLVKLFLQMTSLYRPGLDNQYRPYINSKEFLSIIDAQLYNGIIQNYGEPNQIYIVTTQDDNEGDLEYMPISLIFWFQEKDFFIEYYGWRLINEKPYLFCSNKISGISISFLNHSEKLSDVYTNTLISTDLPMSHKTIRTFDQVSELTINQAVESLMSGSCLQFPEKFWYVY